MAIKSDVECQLKLEQLKAVQASLRNTRANYLELSRKKQELKDEITEYVFRNVVEDDEGLC